MRELTINTWKNENNLTDKWSKINWHSNNKNSDSVNK